MTTYPPLLELDAIDQLPFNPAEYDARLAACRQEMLERGLDYLVLNSPENIYYLSGFITRGYYVFQALVVTHTSDPILVVRRYEQVNVELLSYYKDLAVWQDTDIPAQVLARTLIDLGAAGKTVGIDANAMFFTASDYEILRETLPSATFVNASSVMEKSRTIKSPQEIAYIRRAAETLSAGFEAAKSAAQPGNTENDVAAAFLHGAVSAGSEYMAGPPYIVSGPRTALPHGTWARRRIEQGDLVLVEGSGKLEALQRSNDAHLVSGKTQRQRATGRRYLYCSPGLSHLSHQTGGNQRGSRCGLPRHCSASRPRTCFHPPHGIFGWCRHLPGVGRGISVGPEGKR